MKKFFFVLLSAVAFMGYAMLSHAGLIGVSQIFIQSTFVTTLQVSEVVATETGTGLDLALASAGASAVGSSSFGTSSPSFAIDGVAPAAFPSLFHAGSTNLSEFLRVTLANPSELDSITLYGRTLCCSARDIYNLTLFDTHGNTLFSATNLNANNAGHFVRVALPNTTVPEPSVMLLLGAGLVGLFGCNYRRRKQAV